MQLSVKSDKEERILIYVGTSEVRKKLKIQAAQLGFPTIASYLKTLSNIPVRKMKEFLALPIKQS